MNFELWRRTLEWGMVCETSFEHMWVCVGAFCVLAYIANGNSISRIYFGCKNSIEMPLYIYIYLYMEYRDLYAGHI